MKLSPETITILKNFSAINQSIIFKPGNVLKTISPQKTVMAEAKVKDEFQVEAGIYNLSRFLAAVSMYNDNPEIEFNDTYLTFSNGKTNSKMIYSDSSMIISPPNKEITLPSTDVSVVITANDLQSVLKATGVLGLPEVAFVGEDGSCYLRALDSSNPSADSHSIEVGKTDDTFTLIIKTENLNIIPSNYNVELSSKGISKFVGQHATYFIAIESKSTYQKG